MKQKTQDDRVRSETVTSSRTNRLAIDFTAMGLDGQPFDGGSLLGKTVLLDFWAVWCAPCVAAFPTLNRLQRDLANENFAVVGLAAYSGTPEDVHKFLKKHKLIYTIVVADETLVQRFEVIGYPTYLLIDSDGKMYKKYVGEVKNLYSQINADVLQVSKKKSAQDK
ncbi:MAG: TlpA disulfide reductase family protein [bacterium]